MYVAQLLIAVIEPALDVHFLAFDFLLARGEGEKGGKKGFLQYVECFFVESVILTKGFFEESFFSFFEFVFSLMNKEIIKRKNG